MRVTGSHQIDTLNSPVSVGHSNSRKPTLIFDLLQISNWKKVWATILIFFSRILMWVPILFYATFVLELILNVLVGSLQEDLGGRLGILELHYFQPEYKISVPHINFPLTLLGLFGVLISFNKCDSFKMIIMSPLLVCAPKWCWCQFSLNFSLMCM